MDNPPPPRHPIPIQRANPQDPRRTAGETRAAPSKHCLASTLPSEKKQLTSRSGGSVERAQPVASAQRLGA